MNRKSRRPSRIPILEAALCVHATASGSGPVEIFMDTAAPGWNYTDTNMLFRKRIDSTCSVSWSVYKGKDTTWSHGKLSLSIHPFDWRSWNPCTRSFDEMAAANTEVLDSLFLRFAPTRFKGLGHGSFGGWNDRSWNDSIALASARSPQYQNNRRHYPKTDLSTNQIFVELANQTKAYRKLEDLLRRHGLGLRMKDVEEVSTPKASWVYDTAQIRKFGLKKSDRLIWDAISIWYTLVPLPALALPR